MHRFVCTLTWCVWRRYKHLHIFIMLQCMEFTVSTMFSVEGVWVPQQVVDFYFQYSVHNHSLNISLGTWHLNLAQI